MDLGPYVLPDYGTVWTTHPNRLPLSGRQGQETELTEFVNKFTYFKIKLKKWIQNIKSMGGGGGGTSHTCNFFKFF
jgi:hypothetical protein